MPFVPVRFEPTMRWEGCVAEISENTFECYLEVTEGEGVGTEVHAELLKTKLPPEEVAKVRAGTLITCAAGQHFDRFGACLNGFEFHVVERLWTPEQQEAAKQRAADFLAAYESLFEKLPP
jgi:hypothetical protein